MMNRLFMYVLFFAMPLLMAAAPAAESPRPPTRENALAKKSIAIVSGTTTNINVAAAQFITESLTEKSLLTVMPQEKLSHLLPKYPANIQGPYTAGYVKGFTEEYAKTDMAKIRAIQQQLRVDYLYVLWEPAADHGARGTITNYFIAQVFQGPKSTAIDNSTFESSATGKSSFVFFNSCLAIVSLKFNDPTKEEQLEELKRNSGEVADHIISVANTTK